MLAPAGTPKAIIDKLAAEMERPPKDPKFVEQLQSTGIDPAVEGPEKFAEFIASEIPNWAKAVEIAGVKCRPIARRDSSLQRDLGVADHLAPARDLGPDPGCELLRRAGRPESKPMPASFSRVSGIAITFTTSR